MVMCLELITYKMDRLVKVSCQVKYTRPEDFSIIQHIKDRIGEEIR